LKLETNSRLETDRRHKKIFTDIWPVADILLTTDADFQNLLTDILTKYFGYSWWELLTRV